MKHFLAITGILAACILFGSSHGSVADESKPTLHELEQLELQAVKERRIQQKNSSQETSSRVVVAIQTFGGNYLTAVKGGGLGNQHAARDGVALRTDSKSAGRDEIFGIVWLNSGHTEFALRTANGNYVTAVNGGGVGGQMIVLRLFIQTLPASQLGKRLLCTSCRTI